MSHNDNGEGAGARDAALAAAFGVNVENMMIRPKKALEPMGDCIVFRPVEADRTAAGLYVPDKVDTRRKAIVVAVGPGKMLDDGSRRPMAIRPGDHIVLWINAPQVGGCNFTDEELFMCREEDVACRVVDAARAAAS